MSKPLDWTTVSDDPNNPEARSAGRAWLKSAQRVHPHADLLGHIESLVAGRRVLDIGVVEHSLIYMNSPDWRHGRICKVATHCMGIDHVVWITPTMAMELARRAGIRLIAYRLVKPFFALAMKRLIGWRLEPVEYSFPDYLYEFSSRD